MLLLTKNKRYDITLHPPHPIHGISDERPLIWMQHIFY